MLLERLRGVIEALLPTLDRDDDWCVYARGWLAGDLQSGRLRDPVFTGRHARLNDWCHQCFVMSTHAAFGSQSDYRRARVYEDVAVCARHIDRGAQDRAAQALDRIAAGIDIDAATRRLSWRV